MMISKKLFKIIRIIFFIVLVTGIKDLSGQTYVKDIEGNIYPVKKFGNNIWMLQNLRVKHGPHCNPIESRSINNDDMNTENYGRLYTWEVAMDGSNVPGSRGICPEGWHIPTDKEWTTLINYIQESLVEGKNTKHQIENALNVVYAGNYNSGSNLFSFKDKETYFWTSDEYNRSNAWMRNISKANSGFNRSAVNKDYSFSLRCVKDP